MDEASYELSQGQSQSISNDVTAGDLYERKRTRSSLYELIKIRVSQINGCSFCLDMHVKDLLEMG